MVVDVVAGVAVVVAVVVAVAVAVVVVAVVAVVVVVAVAVAVAVVVPFSFDWYYLFFLLTVVAVVAVVVVCCCGMLWLPRRIFSTACKIKKTSISFAAVGSGLALASSSRAFRFQLLRFGGRWGCVWLPKSKKNNEKINDILV